MTAPLGGATSYDIVTLIWEILRWYYNKHGARLRVIVSLPHDDSAPDEVCIVAYTRKDGTGHRVLKYGKRFFCYQNSDIGIDVTSEVNESTIRAVWRFDCV